MNAVLFASLLPAYLLLRDLLRNPSCCTTAPKQPLLRLRYISIHPVRGPVYIRRSTVYAMVRPFSHVVNGNKPSTCCEQPSPYLSTF
jgi:hypothetical protein